MTNITVLALLELNRSQRAAPHSAGNVVAFPCAFCVV
jgi:hypothetical protein